MTDLVTFGESMLRLSPPGHQRLETVDRLDVHVAGAESNVAVAAQRLGLDAVWTSKLPDSPLGRRVTSALDSHGVDTEVVWDAEHRQGTYYVESGGKPRGTNVIYDRADAAVTTATPGELPTDEVAAADAFHTTGITPALSAQLLETTAELLSLAQSEGTTTVFDVNYRSKLWEPPEARETIEELLPDVDVLVVAERDARAVLDREGDAEAIARGLDEAFGFAVTLVTRGGEGSLALSDAPAEGRRDDPAFETHGLHCYHGTTIAVDDDLYGTVCFVSEAPRERPFSELETTFAELLARMLERELERRQSTATIERYEEFASVLSHDLRNPLNVAQGRAELERNERDSENLAVAVRSLDRIESIIASVLRVAREGRDVETASTVSLSALADRCWEAIDSGDATLLVDDNFTFRADSERVRSVFENLFRNAVEHGGDGVTIRVGPLDDDEGFYVEDDGPGIPESVRETVFDPGYTTGREGVGLGLSIVESAVEAHGWQIEATESTIGGARFEISGIIPG